MYGSKGQTFANACFSLVKKRTVLAAAVLASGLNGATAVAGDYFLFATAIPNVADWNNESYAIGDPGCGNGCPCDDGDYVTNASGTGYMTATDFQSFTLPPNEVIVSVRINALTRFDNGEGGEIRLKASLPSFGIEATRDSGVFTSDLTCEYEFSVAEGEITSEAQNWTQAMINNMQVGIRRLSSNPPSGNTLRCKAIRIRVITEAAPPPPPPPGNDECSGAILIGNGSIAFNTELATTSEGGLPASCTDSFVKDVWYRYTATCTGNATFTTCGTTDSDTVMAVYSGSCGALSLAGCSDEDDECDFFGPSTVSIPVTAGAAYYVRLGGYEGAVTGSLVSSCVSAPPPPPPPGNDECGGAIVIGNGSTPFTTTTATTSSGDLPISCTDTIVKDVWYRYTATCTGTATFTTCGTTDSDTVMAVYSGSCGALSLAGCSDEDDECDFFGPSTVSIPVTAGATYYVRLGGYEGAVTGSLLSGCSSAPPPPPPGNDECSGAILIGNGSIAFNTTLATTSGPSLPASCTDSFVKDVWYRYTATCTGTATFTTCGATDSDTVLAVYSGSCGALSLAGCGDEDDECDFFGPSTVSIPVTAGASYYIRVGGYEGPVTGSLVSSCAAAPPPPANNECTGATLIGNGSTAFNTAFATTSGPGLPASCTDSFVKDVWYRYVATCSGTATFTTCGTTDSDTVLAVYSGSCGTLSLAGCSDEDDECDFFGPSTVSIPVTAGATYYVRLGGYDGAVSGSLVSSCVNPDLNGDQKVDAFDLAVLLGAWGGSGAADLDNSGQVNAEDLAILLGSWT
jgi:ABC-type uncharacterized transport system auxiliary subunit